MIRRGFRSLMLFSVLLTVCLAVSPARAEDPCLDCHRKETPGIVNYYEKSIHFEKKLSCSDCHGKEIDANHQRRTIVEASICGRCHEPALTAHRQSKHAIGLKTGRGCTRNMEKTPEREKSCLFCHKPGSSEPFVLSECAMF